MTAKEFKNWLLTKATEVQNLIDSGDWNENGVVKLETWSGDTDTYTLSDPEDTMKFFTKADMHVYFRCASGLRDRDKYIELLDKYNLKDVSNGDLIIINNGDL